MRDHETQGSHGISRRGLLGAGAAGGGLLLLSSIASAKEAEAVDESHDDCYHCVDPAMETDLTTAQIEASHDQATTLSLTTRNHISGTILIYEPTGKRTNFSFDRTFFSQLEGWRGSLGHHALNSWGSPDRIDSYGAYVNKPGMHGLGRAFDIANVRFWLSDGSTRNLNCRYDQWRNWDVDKWRPRYWGLSASLHLRFQHVLTYLYNRQHWNHIHVDNAVYGSKSGSRFSSGSSAQVQHVQACCRYLFGYSTTIDGIWGSQTSSHSTGVLRRYGVSSGTIRSNDGGVNWRKFNFASMRQGLGKISI